MILYFDSVSNLILVWHIKKEEPADDECKSEPMGTSTGSTGEDKKPEVKTEPKEEEAAGTNSSPTNTQSKKKGKTNSRTPS